MSLNEMTEVKVFKVVLVKTNDQLKNELVWKSTTNLILDVTILNYILINIT